MEEKDLLYKYSVYVWQIQVVLYLKAELSCSFPLYKGAHKLSQDWLKQLSHERCWWLRLPFLVYPMNLVLSHNPAARIICIAKQTRGPSVHPSALLFSSLLDWKRKRVFLPTISHAGIMSHSRTGSWVSDQTSGSFRFLVLDISEEIVQT